ncbi:hypothetical protein GCM10022378_17930 [Salinicoccus jeotgali]|uniref:Response regulatory domain-containing protein n=1 Tax=Salinicoccus jeotgali TaxID=381634 RepID=A0ABP7F7F9_9STAP
MSEHPVEIHIVEPDPVFLRILLRTLEDYEAFESVLVHGYENGHEFLEHYEYKGIYCIFIINDVLPKKNGTEIAKRIRKDDSKSTIYFMTRSNTEEEMVYALNSGVDGYFIKPFNLKVFQAKVNRLLDKGEKIWN